MPAARSSARPSDLAPAVKPGPDMYLGLLVLSLLAQIAAVLFLYMDYSSYPQGGKPPSVAKVSTSVGAVSTPPAGGAPTAPAPAAPGGPANAPPPANPAAPKPGGAPMPVPSPAPK